MINVSRSVAVLFGAATPLSAKSVPKSVGGVLLTSVAVATDRRGSGPARTVPAVQLFAGRWADGFASRATGCGRNRVRSVTADGRCDRKIRHYDKKIRRSDGIFLSQR